MENISVQDICSSLEDFAPPALQESWDNSGLIVGSPSQPVGKVLLTIDVTEAVVAEAVEQQAQMIVSHHPPILSGIRQLTGKTDVQRAIISAVRHRIAIYAAHTSIDAAWGGVSHRMAQKLGLGNIRVLSPREGGLRKLVAYIPAGHFEQVRDAVFEAGAGCSGNYDCCGYSAEGKGTFRALEGAHPFVGQLGKRHAEPEIRFETVFPSHLQRRVVEALLQAHPYEEAAFDILTLQNPDRQAGLGVTGVFASPVSEHRFLQMLKETFAAKMIRHTRLRGGEIRKAALCGGSGSSLLEHAIRSHADVLVTADCKYHQFAEAEDSILLADLGHFESEQYTKEIFYDVLMKKFPNFAVQFSKINTNPINYL
ncbi:MAG: Nif3-like dinuclear metal center hexameric protein [Bacteroidales bacterium]|nr:Nif3-like dinuclear metal center hexameric protein [Bacteroidales bacterium]